MLGLRAPGHETSFALDVIRAPSWVWALTLVVTLGLVAVATVPTWNDPGHAIDEGLLLVEPEELLGGELPNEDFESFYGPANTQLLAGIYAITGVDVEVERAIGLVYRLALAAAIFALATPAGIFVAAFAGLVAGFLTAGPAALGWYAAVALALWSMWGLTGASADPGRSALLRWAGVAAGLAISFRPQLALAIGLCAVPLLWRRTGVARGYGLWVVVGSLPLLVHVALAGPASVFENLVVDALFRSGPESTLPYPPLSSPSGRLFLLLAGSVAALVVAAALAWRRAPRADEARRLAALALFAIGLLPHTLGRPDVLHILFVACVAVPLVPVALSSPLVLGRLQPDTRALVAIAATSVAVWVGAKLVLEGIEANYLRALGASTDPVAQSYDRRENWVEWNSRSFPSYSAQGVADIEGALAAVERLTEPGDRVVIGPADLSRTFTNDTALYHLLPDLEPATYYLTMSPGTANREASRLPADIAAADAVILGLGGDPQAGIPHGEAGSSDAVEVLKGGFCLRFQNASYLVYEHCR